MSQQEDQTFFDTFMVILGALVIFAFAMFAIAKFISGNTQVSYLKSDPDNIKALQQRIEPVGQVIVAGKPRPVIEKAAAAVAVMLELSGEEAYSSACAACHTAGIAGAPKTGDVSAWASRITQGLDVLSEHAINGYQGEAGVMPAKGGRSDLSDDTVRAAVEYMVEAVQ